VHWSISSPNQKVATTRMLVGFNEEVKRKKEEDEVEANEIVYTLLDGTIPPLAQI
jgi:hypothetical protein